jgi:hypothetical protein
MVPLPSSETRGAVLASLEAIARAQDVDDRVRALAAAVAVRLDPSQQSLLIDLLEDGGTVRRALFGIFDDLRGLIDDAKLVGLVASLFRDPELAVSSIRAAGCARIPGFIESCWDTLPASGESARAELLFWLAFLEPNRRSLEAWSAGMRELGAKGRARCLFALTALTQQRDRALAAEACELASDHYFARLRQHGRGMIETQNFGSVFEHGDGPKAKDLADYILGSFDDPWFCQYAVVYHARHDGDGGIARLARALARPHEKRDDNAKWRAAAGVARTVFGGSQNSDAAKAFGAIDPGKAPGDVAALVDLLLSIGGPFATTRARSLVQQLPPDRRGAWMRRLNAPDPTTVLAELKRGGIVTDVELDTLAPRIAEGEGREDQVFVVLEAADVLVLFDAESDEVPAPYGPLLQLFKDVSRGVFEPEAVQQTFTSGEDAGADNEYMVQFIHGERLYTFFPSDLRDWYDVDVVVEACNMALADAGREERFLCAENDGQCATYGCFTPAQADFLAQAFHIDWA